MYGEKLNNQPATNDAPALPVTARASRKAVQAASAGAASASAL
jgi:hypothetical protein